MVHFPLNQTTEKGVENYFDLRLVSRVFTFFQSHFMGLHFSILALHSALHKNILFKFSCLQQAPRAASDHATFIFHGVWIVILLHGTLTPRFMLVGLVQMEEVASRAMKYQPPSHLSASRPSVAFKLSTRCYMWNLHRDGLLK